MSPDEEALAALLDRQAVIDVVTRYATAVDSRDWPLYRTCFTDPVKMDFSSLSPSLCRTYPVDEWVAGVRASLEGFDATQHVGTNHVVELRGNEASCVSYVQAHHMIRRGEGVDGADRYTVGGRYHNELVRTPQGWKIRRCRLEVTWAEGDRRLFAEAARRAAGDGP